MKILHISGNSLGKKSGGGVSVVLRSLVKYQNEINDVDSSVLSINYNTENFSSNKYYYFNSLRQEKEFILDYDPDIIIFHGTYFWRYIFLGIFVAKNKYKYFIEPHSSLMLLAQNKSKFKKTIANKVFFRRFFSNAYGYIYLNKNEKNESIFNSKNDVIIPNGVNIPDISIKSNKAIDGKIKIFFLGRIDINHKGIDILLNELKKIDNPQSNFSLDFFGYGQNKDIKYLKEQIADFNDIEISFKGAVFDKAKEEVFKNYHIMILTSRYEGFPMSVLEALSYGNPCIVTPGTNVKEMIEENDLGWGTEFKSLSQTILKALFDYEKNYNDYIIRTTEFIEQNFSWDKIAELSISKLKNII